MPTALPRATSSSPAREVRVRYSQLGSEEYSDARLVDVSEGGLCMEASKPLRTGTEIYVQLLNHQN